MFSIHRIGSYAAEIIGVPRGRTQGGLTPLSLSPPHPGKTFSLAIHNWVTWQKRH